MKKTAVFLFFFTFFISLPVEVNAFSSTMPDGTDSSGDASVRLVNARTRYVRSSDSKLAAWLPSSSGTIRIHNYNYCGSNTGDFKEGEDYYGSNPLANGSNVTRYEVNGQVVFGKKYANGAANCNDSVDIAVSGLTNIENGYYKVPINVDFVLSSPSGFPGLSNAYFISLPNGGKVGVRENDGIYSGHSTTQEQINSSPSYINYYGKFGTPCDATGSLRTKIVLYDLDNAGGSGAQPAGQDVTVALRDITEDKWVNIGGDGTDYGGNTVWTPPNSDNTLTERAFTARKGHKYRLEIRNVYYNNTIQYSLPFSQIFFEDCPPSASIVKHATPNTTIDVGRSVSFRNWITTTAEYTRNAIFRWNITGVGSRSGGSTVIDGSNPRVDDTHSEAFDQRGTYTRSINITGKPDYATESGNGTGTVNVRGWDIGNGINVDGVKSKYVLVGTTVTFRAWVCNNGAAPNQAPNHVVIDSNYYPPDGGAADLGTLDIPQWSPYGTCREKIQTYSTNTPGEHCASLYVNPIADNNRRNNGDPSPRACVHVVLATPNKPPLLQYEKGSGDLSVIYSMNINIGADTCPPGTPVNIPYSYNIPAPIGLSGAGSVPYGDQNCPSTFSIPAIDLSSRAGVLNSSTPGTLYPATFTVNGITDTGGITVYEVPFARFYGNDIYAPNGEIRFNDATSDPDYDGRGSAAQYAALSFGNVTIDTSAFRTLPVGPKPPGGLDVANSPLTKASVSTVLQNVRNGIPSTCGTFNGGPITGLATGCYRKNNPSPLNINGGTYNTKVTIDTSGDNVIINNDITNTSSFTPPPPPAPPAVAATVYQHINFNDPPWNLPGAYARSLGVGDYNAAQLSSLGIPPNDISSLSVASGCTVILYDNGNFTGETRTYTNSVYDFTTSTVLWNDRTESIRISCATPPPTPVVVDNFGVMLIVADNIYISPNVQRIDAILVANNTIYTCSNGTSPVSNANLDEQCRNNLTINGSIAAPTIKFQRVGGSRYLYNTGAESEEQSCVVSRGIQNCSARGAMPLDTGKTAEIVNFPAYLYFSKPYLEDTTDSGDENEAMFVAPPRR